MKNIFRLTAVALLAATLFSACTGAFEDMNTNPKGVSDEELKQDNNYIGMHFIPMMQLSIIIKMQVSMYGNISLFKI